MDLIHPHGEQLINRYVDGSKREAMLKKAASLVKIPLDDKNISDLEMIADGAMSPLSGFMTQEDYHSVVQNMRLDNGLVWPIPVTLAVDDALKSKIEGKEQVALVDHEDRILAVLNVKDIFQYDKKEEAQKVYLTDDPNHPGVAYVYQQGDYCVGGAIDMLSSPNHEDFLEYRLSPRQTRDAFKERGWTSVVAFQTRNPIHRAHEYLQKCALEIVDGLLLHPLVGRTKSDDIPAEVRMKSYEVLIENYFPKERVLLSVFPAAMRYAGPREAIFHALVRKNYGCTHFIVGRDHAGVGTYYGTYDAQRIFDNFKPEEIGITPLKFEHSFYCKRTQSMATTKTSSSSPEDRLSLSGTKVRDMLKRAEAPPPEFMRPEVAQVLIEAMQTN